MREWGFTNPLLIDEDNGIIAGHGRALAAGVLKMETVPAVRLTGLTAAQKRALVISDNKIALNGGWDLDLLALELKGLADMGFNLDLTGFGKLELGKISKLGSRTAGDDEAPAPPEKPTSVLGDVWLLGSHRVMCGDSSDSAALDILMDGKKADLCFTDPPYGLSIGDKNKMLKEFRPSPNSVGTNIEADTLSPDALVPLPCEEFPEKFKQAMAGDR